MDIKEPIIQTPEERRKMCRSRPDYSDRRTNTRFLGEFPVTIYVGKDGNEKVYHAIARDVSDGGILLENVDIPENEGRIRLDFKIPEATMPEEYLHGKISVEGDVRRYDKDGRKVGIAFTKGLSQQLESTWNFLRLPAVLGLFLTIALIFYLKRENVYFFFFDIPVFLYSITVSSYLISRFLFASIYRAPKATDYRPTVSIIVPAFNEGGAIRQTIINALEISYPREKFQVIAVNDGSSDNTLDVMKDIRNSYPDLIIVDMEQNRGKRPALEAGTRISNGEILVFVDSDSLLEPDAVKKIVDAFVDPKIAGVCGHCDVANQWTNILTKMQSVRYYVGFRVMKAAESIFDTVTCLSGPLAAYRRDVLMAVMDDWVNQTILGRPATYGDDRSLTNFILKLKYKVIYDSRSRCRTIVPQSYRQFFKQQMRWKRSWFRESLRLSTFVWRLQPLMSISFYLGFILPVLGPLVVLRSIIWVPLVHHGSPLVYILGVFLMSSLMSVVYLFVKRSRLWVYGIFFCFFYMFVIIWQMPWAMVTFTKTKWGTRA